MKYVNDGKKYAAIYKKYRIMSQVQKNVERAHYQYQKDILPAVGLYLSLFALATSNLFESKTWAAVTIASFAFLALYLGMVVRNASMHLSVINDIEKE